MEIGNNDTFEFTCVNGHKNIFFLNIPRYSLHFENGLEAYLNDNYIEAFVSFFSALEDYRLEFAKSYLYMFCNVPYEVISEQFKDISKQSERIYGAYVSAYLGYFKRPVDIKKSGEFYPILANETVRLRNAIVHKGYYPSKEEVEEHGYLIYQHIKYHTMNYTHIFGETEELPVSIQWGLEKLGHWINSSKNQMKTHKIEIVNSDISTMRTTMVPEHDKIKTFDELLEIHENLKKTVNLHLLDN